MFPVGLRLFSFEFKQRMIRHCTGTGSGLSYLCRKRWRMTATGHIVIGYLIPSATESGSLWPCAHGRLSSKTEIFFSVFKKHASTRSVFQSYLTVHTDT